MKDRHGKIVSFETKEGVQTAIMYDNEQTPSFQAKKKAVLRLVDDKLEPIMRDNKPVIAVKKISELTKVGYVD